jgi:Chaperone of endosialidase
MSKISTYETVPVPKLSDKLIGTSVGGEIEDVTYNFTLQELLELFLPVIPANNLQGILDYGNTATQDINLFGTITTTNLDVTGTANLFITYLNEETYIVGGLYDSVNSIGTSGQLLSSTGSGVAWVTLPPIFTPNLQQVLEEGNTADIDIVLDADLEAINITTDTANIANQLSIQGVVVDYNESAGTLGQVLSSTSTGIEWVNLPAYSAASPLLLNNVTKVFSIQQASNVQGGYLSAADWINFDGKQPAGNYITALTGEASASGPGAASTILSNAAVINKVLTGFNPTAGTINASDSILVALGKAQSQINSLVGGVVYQGTWNASANVPTLTSSVGVQGHYYIVSVAGNVNLNGITDWKVGDWAIFSESIWQKVDNTDSVSSVNGFTGAVNLTTDNIPEGINNLYYLNSRARNALSFSAGSGGYDNVTGVITIPTDNNQILNGAGYITLASLSASAPLAYNNLTGGFSIQKADATHDGYLSSTDWTTFNNKQNYLGGTGLVKSTAGTITYITDNSTDWNTAYDRSIVSAAVTGTSTKTLTLTEQDGNTIQASWTDLDTGLTSVGVSMPSAFSVANSPLTSNGTIAITGAGTSLQYIDGTGALQNFPELTGFVPYIGANQNVDLGEYGISAGYFQADLTPSGALQVGRMQWNATDGTMDLRLLGNNVTLQIGEENVTRVVNKSGVDLLEANYQVVRVRKVAEGGAQGQRLAVVLAQGNNENNSTEVLGLVTETINSNQEGFITCFGEVKNIDTTGALQGETWVDGDILYVSPTIAGQLTNIRPVAPNHAVTVGYVTYAHANNGKIYMAIDTGYELGELHNVYAPSPNNNESIYWNATNGRYQLNTIAGVLGYTPADDSLVVHLAGTETITGTKTFTTKVTINTGGTDDQLQLVGAAPSVRLSNAVSGATINGFIAMAGASNNYIQGAVPGDMTIGNQNNGRILFGFGAGTATQKMSLDSLGNAIFAGGITLGGGISNGTYNYTLPSANGTIALVGGTGVGTVTSVSANAGTGISISGSPITTSGTFCITNTAPYSGQAVIVAGSGLNSSVRCSSGNTANNNYSSALGGFNNTASGAYSSVLAGNNNNTSGQNSFIGGGGYNVASGYQSFVGAGNANCATSSYSFVGGGSVNSSSGMYSSVVGGYNNKTIGSFNFVGGGIFNYVCSTSGSFIGAGSCNFICQVYSSIGGGCCNYVSGTVSSIGGGFLNKICETTIYNFNIPCGATISGGQENTALSCYGTIGGGYFNRVGCTISASYAGLNCQYTGGNNATVSGGNSNLVITNFSGIGSGQNNSIGCLSYSAYSGWYGPTILFNSFGDCAFIGGGYNNIICSNGSFIGGGYNNIAAFGAHATIGGGQYNIACGNNSFVGGGFTNKASGIKSTVVGGACNTASAYYASIVGGFLNVASTNYTFIGGGRNNTASAAASAILGGNFNTVSGQYSGAFGYGVVNSIACSFASNQLWACNLVGTSVAVCVGTNGLLVRGASDCRLKTNICDISYGLCDVNKLRPVSFDWNEQERDRRGCNRQVGFIAQEVEPIVPEAVGQQADNGEYSLSPDKLIPILTKGLQELSEENVSLKARLEAIEQHLNLK